MIMAAIQYPNSGSTLSYPGSGAGKNKTSTAISTNIIIQYDSPAGRIPIGAIQDINFTEARTIHMVYEIGTDGAIDSVPQSSTKITGTCRRVRFDGARITEAFGRGFLHVSAQSYPFDIVITDTSKQNTNSQIITVVKNVWINNLTQTFNAENWIITDSMNFEAEYIFSYRAGGENAASGGERPIPISKIDRERAADRGQDGRRGSLDVSGLIDLGSDGKLF